MNSGSQHVSVPDRRELQRFLELAETAAIAVGKVLLDWAGRFSVREKGRADLVTEADEASQKVIHDLIAAEFPDHGFLGEEGLQSDPGTSDLQWIIDPLDGTSNYVHGFPYYAVSIGLCRGSVPLVGVIHDPNRSETFTAIASHGAWLNGTAIQTTGETELQRTMGMASLPVGATDTDPAVRRFLKAMNHLQTVQRTGSAALNLASVACGRVDVFWSTSLKPWDVAAGVLLVTEAGGTVTSLSGGPFDIFV
ncbi:MAG: inositol monophosphatase, partial [Planctomycetaceae bacterium]|nr:inositol monophosphatase [Planctomycetaceae bacterium]